MFIRKYWLALLNEIGKTVAASGMLYIVLGLWNQPTEYERHFGLAAGLLGTVVVVLLVDVAASIRALFKGNHRLLPKPKFANRDALIWEILTDIEIDERMKIAYIDNAFRGGFDDSLLLADTTAAEIWENEKQAMHDSQ